MNASTTPPPSKKRPAQNESDERANGGERCLNIYQATIKCSYADNMSTAGAHVRARFAHLLWLLNNSLPEPGWRADRQGPAVVPCMLASRQGLSSKRSAECDVFWFGPRLCKTITSPYHYSPLWCSVCVCVCVCAHMWEYLRTTRTLAGYIFNPIPVCRWHCQ